MAQAFGTSSICLHTSSLRSKVLVCDGSFGCGGYEFGVFTEDAAFFAGTFGLEGIHTVFVIVFVNIDRNRILDSIDFDLISRLNDADRSTFSGFWGDVAYVETVTATGETAVSDESNVIDQPTSSNG